jgi:hypothetical protein
MMHSADCSNVLRFMIANENRLFFVVNSDCEVLITGSLTLAPCSIQLQGGAVTSVVLSEGPARDGSFVLYVGTAKCNVYLVRYGASSSSLRFTLHFSARSSLCCLSCLTDIATGAQEFSTVLGEEKTSNELCGHCVCSTALKAWLPK